MPEAILHAVGRGLTWHTRLAPVEHRFQYHTAMIFLDLDQLNTFESSKLKVNSRSLLSFKTAKHLCDNFNPSGEKARQAVLNEIDVDVSGAVKLLTNPHIFGVGFNPLSIYFLHKGNGDLSALIYEVSNTPWNEVYRYVIPFHNLANGQAYHFAKMFHVSPFNPLNQQYETRLAWTDNQRLRMYLGLRNDGDDNLIFEAGLNLTLEAYQGLSIKPLFLGIWPQTFLVMGGIYREAFSLWRKGLQYYRHP